MRSSDCAYTAIAGLGWAGLDRKSSAALDWTASPVTINLNHHVLSRGGRACPDRTRTIPCKVRAVTLQFP